MRKMKKFICVGVIGFMSAQGAFGMPQDYSQSIYGEKAKDLFNKSTKLTPTCSYEKTSDSTNEVLNGRTIDGKAVNALQCKLIGEGTYACEETTAWYSNPCEIQQPVD